MTVQDNTQLIKRLERLERHNRRLTRLGVAGIAVLGIVLCMGASGDKPEVLDEIRVKKLVVEDDAGTVRFLMEGDNEGARFLMNDIRGKKRVTLAISEKRRTATLSLIQSDGRLRMGTGCTDGGPAWVNLVHSRGPSTKVARGMSTQ